jgi:enterochelin esterase-like enzyme
MPMSKDPGVSLHKKSRVEHVTVTSECLERDVKAELYLPPSMEHPSAVSLLLVNDGQDLPKMHFKRMLDGLYEADEIRPLLVVGIHAGRDRKHEYGTASTPDYKDRGSRASDYTRFIFRELLPFVRQHTHTHHFRDKSFCGFSLGGLTAMDIVWSHPHEFLHAGVFSGSFWWRSKALDDGYDEDRDRIMHDLIRKGSHAPWLKFFLQTGQLDEKEDRNQNGIIDSIDDTLDLIRELVAKGYDRLEDIRYLELEDGRHDVETWGRAMPVFLRWAFGNHRS